MHLLVIALFYPASKVLSASNIRELCLFAHKARTRCALTCILAFILLVGTVIFYRSLPFELIPMTLAVLFAAFVVFAMLASRFGRLCNCENNIKDKSNITHLCELQPECKNYYNEVIGAGRPFTRLDLYKIGRIFLMHNKRR